MNTWHETYAEVASRNARKNAEHKRLVELGRVRKNLAWRLDDLINATVWWYNGYRASTAIRRIAWKLYQLNPDDPTVRKIAEVDRLMVGALRPRAALVRTALRELF